MLWGLKGSCWRNAVFLNLKTTVPLKPSCSTIVMMVSKCFQHISYGSPTLPSSYRKTTVSPKPSCSWKCGGVGPILWYCGWSTVQRFLLFWKTTVPPKRSFSNFGYLVPMNTTLLYIVAFDHYCGYIPQPHEVISNLRIHRFPKMDVCVDHRPKQHAYSAHSLHNWDSCVVHRLASDRRKIVCLNNHFHFHHLPPRFKPLEQYILQCW